MLEEMELRGPGSKSPHARPLVFYGAPAGRSLLHFRNATTGWEELAAAAGPAGLPGWEHSTPLHHCRWAGVSCCRIDAMLAATAGVKEHIAVCALQLEHPGTRAAADDGSAAGAGTTGGTTAAVSTSLSPLWQLRWLTSV